MKLLALDSHWLNERMVQWHGLSHCGDGEANNHLPSFLNWNVQNWNLLIYGQNIYPYITAIHTGAHIFNVERYVEAYNSRDLENRQLLRTLSSLPSQPNGTFLNPFRSGDTVCWYWILISNRSFFYHSIILLIYYFIICLFFSAVHHEFIIKATQGNL